MNKPTPEEKARAWAHAALLARLAGAAPEWDDTPERQHMREVIVPHLCAMARRIRRNAKGKK